ncbi:MAG: hypothetical protein ABI442_11430 [Gemmatimonadaceae bacterium]
MTAQHGGIIDSVVVQSSQLGDSTAVPLGDTPGTYALTITKPGYRDWKRTNIDVGSSSCGQAETQIFTAFLQRL